ncbi:hypothetical protein E4U35_003556 [Claviceps purpurea]|nr:hypothetical protein E4U35_003556 [Claviceps purpurea]KAG6257713.1 hypothetical protein E4U49_006745 [Claviceps purpurea]
MSVVDDMQSCPGTEFVNGTEPIEELLDAVAEDELLYEDSCLHLFPARSDHYKSGMHPNAVCAETVHHTPVIPDYPFSSENGILAPHAWLSRVLIQVSSAVAIGSSSGALKRLPDMLLYRQTHGHRGRDAVENEWKIKHEGRDTAVSLALTIVFSSIPPFLPPVPLSILLACLLLSILLPKTSLRSTVHLNGSSRNIKHAQ